MKEEFLNIALTISSLGCDLRNCSDYINDSLSFYDLNELSERFSKALKLCENGNCNIKKSDCLDLFFNSLTCTFFKLQDCLSKEVLKNEK